MRALCGPRGSASWGRGAGVSAEAPPGLGFTLFQKAPGLLDRVQSVAGGHEKRRQRERSEEGGWHFPLAVLPPPLCTKAGNADLEAWRRRGQSHLKQDQSGEGVGVKFRDLHSAPAP